MTAEQALVLEAPKQYNIFKLLEEYKKSDFFISKSPNSQASYNNDLKHFEEFCYTQGISTLRELKPQLITHWADLMKNGKSAEATIARRVSAVRSFLTWAIAEGLLSEDFIQDSPTYPAERLSPEILTPKQVRKLIDETVKNIDKRDAAIVQILVKTGAKATEFVELKTDDILINSDQTAVRIGTGKRNERAIILGEEAGEIVREYLSQRKPEQLEAGQPLFTSNSNGRLKEPLTRQGVWLILKEYGAKIGVPNLNTNTLRFTFAANLHGTLSERAEVLGVVENTVSFTDQLMAKAVRKGLKPKFKSAF